jgi:hypothetical protein
MNTKVLRMYLAADLELRHWNVNVTNGHYIKRKTQDLMQGQIHSC